MITGITRAYAPRPIRYLGLLHCNDWRIKTYSISVKRERVDEATVEYVRTYFRAGWHKASCMICRRTA